MKKKNILIRECKIQDSMFIYDLYNSNVKKKNFNQNKTVTFKSHQKWIKNILKSKKSIIYIGLFDTKFGYVRIENLFDNFFNISIAVTDKHIGMGYSGKFLNLSINKFLKKRKNSFLFSFVKKNNFRSKNFFLSNSFFEIKVNDKNKFYQFLKKDNNIFFYFKQLSLKRN